MKFNLKSGFFSLSGLICLVASGFGVNALADPVRLTNPNAVLVEVLGRGLRFQVAADRVLSNQIVVGVGYGNTSAVSPSGANVVPHLVSAYGNFYFSEDQGSIYATLGATLTLNPSAASGAKSDLGGLLWPSHGVFPQVGAGYEYRSDAGFMFRATAYVLLGKNDGTFAGIRPWGGLSIGYSF